MKKILVMVMCLFMLFSCCGCDITSKNDNAIIAAERAAIWAKNNNLSPEEARRIAINAAIQAGGKENADEGIDAVDEIYKK